MRPKPLSRPALPPRRRPRDGGMPLRGSPVARRGSAARRPRPLLTLRRRPRLWWGVALALGVLAGATVASSVTGAEAARQAWGELSPVLVARRDLRPGESVDSGDFEPTELPVALVPHGALRELPADSVLNSATYRGEVLLGARLASGSSRLAAVLPAGTRAVAIPVEPGTALPLEPGDHVDVLVALPVDGADGGPPGFAVATGALVVDVTEAAVTVAVAEREAPRIAVSLGSGAVTLALVGDR